MTEKREWSSESGLDEMRRSSSAETVTVAERLLSWANDRNLPVAWGSGAKIGYAHACCRPRRLDRRSLSACPRTVNSTSTPTDATPPAVQQDDLRLEFVRSIGERQGRASRQVIDQSFKSFPLSDFSRPETYKAVVAALDWFVEQTGTAHASA